tara:strand:+ start:10661 stop:10846 length:186 start_codon:yes stop_codon:yes gene_type:complete
VKPGDLVITFSHPRKIGLILDFSIDFLINRYDVPEYRILWQFGYIGNNVSARALELVSESR